jgi:SAM-dependent methyltransferase
MYAVLRFMLYIIHTLPGLGPLAWREAESNLPIIEDRPPATIGTRFVPGRNDMVLVNHGGGPNPLLKLRIADDIFAVAARGFKIAPDDRGPRQVYAVVRNSPFVGDAVNAWRKANGGARQQGLSYRVIARLVGKHKFLRRDFGKAVSDAISEGWPGRWTRVEEEADVEVWATLIDDELICAIRLSDKEMRQGGKLRHIPASLRPALGAAMVLLSEPKPNDIFLDPMAGAGTILYERAMAGKFAELHGGDSSPEAVSAMRANLRGVGGEIILSRWDARSLPLEDETVDKVVVNLPFGKQVAEEVNLPNLYRAVLPEIERVLRRNGRFIALVGDVHLLDTARTSSTKQLRALDRHRVQLLGQAATICEHQKR